MQFGTFLWRGLPNDREKFLKMRFWRQRQPLAVKSFILCLLHENYSCQLSEATLRPFHTERDQRGIFSKYFNDRVVLFWSNVFVAEAFVAS